MLIKSEGPGADYKRTHEETFTRNLIFLIALPLIVVSSASRRIKVGAHINPTQWPRGDLPLLADFVAKVG
jgi:hypothetical protein